MSKTVRHMTGFLKKKKNSGGCIRKSTESLLMMGFFGYDVSDDSTIREYPNRETSSGIAQMTKSLEEQNPKKYRVLSDNENSGTFRVATRDKDGALVTVRDGFSDRKAAEDWRKNVSDASHEVTRVLDDGMSKGISRGR